MRKRSLDLDALAVESFAAGRRADSRGTVQANEVVLAGSVYSSCESCCCPSHHQSECC